MKNAKSWHVDAAENVHGLTNDENSVVVISSSSPMQLMTARSTYRYNHICHFTGDIFSLFHIICFLNIF